MFVKPKLSINDYIKTFNIYIQLVYQTNYRWSCFQKFYFLGLEQKYLSLSFHPVSQLIVVSST